MIRLRLQVLESEAEELGWPPRLQRGKFGSREAHFVAPALHEFQATQTIRNPLNEPPGTDTPKRDLSVEYHRLQNHDSGRDHALIKLDMLHKSRIRFGAKLIELESAGADSKEIEEVKSSLTQLIDQMTELEEKYDIGSLEPNAVRKAAQRINSRKNKQNEILEYNGPQSSEDDWPNKSVSTERV